MYPLLILSLVSVEDDNGRPVCGNGGVADKVILCATFEALANPFTTTGICIPNAVVAKEGDDNVQFPTSIFDFFENNFGIVPAPTSSRATVTPFTSAETKGLIILDWTTGAFLRNPIAAASTPIIGLDSTVSSDAGMSGSVVGDDDKATSRSARSCSVPCETFSSFRSLRRLDSQQAWCLSPPCPSSISIPDLQAEPSSTSPSIPLRWFSRPSR